MMKKHNFARRMLALLLVLAMTAGFLPVMTNAAAELTVSNKVADPETLNNWQLYYGDSALLPNGTTGISTWKAGGVWTDKSVFANDTDITAAGLPTSLADQNAFLVSLSALASTKEVVGQSSVPTDTMLVLDLSQSMDNSGSVDDMIKAANEAIDTLLKMNVNNRVGVVLYSGNTTTSQPGYTTSATVILPLDHYTTTTTSTDREQQNGNWVQVTRYQYLTVTGNSDTTVSVANGTRNSQNVRPSGSKNTNGGTYIQNGLFQAWEQFEGMTDKGVVQSGPQAGAQRHPVVILMSDGRPTLATSAYNNIGTSETAYGNGNSQNTTWRTVFLTQLTAAWMKGAVQDHYNDTAAKFYTLGLGTGTDTYATTVLNPTGTTNSDILSWWSNFQNNAENTDGTVEIIEETEAVGRPGRPGYVAGQDGWYLDYDNDGFATGIGRNYVDNYWSADDVDEMIEKFQQIVEEIGLQSAYTATLVQSGEADLDGYITVEDELGSMMQVKDIKGILLGDTLFTGAEFAKSMNAGDLGGDADNATDYGNEFIRTVKERLNIDTSTAQQLVNAAYMDSQLSYTNDSTYSNYLGWYGDADNNYLGFWDKDTGFAAAGAPSNAKYINKCYLYLGEAHSSDMMHVIVQVHTEIATGHQTVLFKVPASLIPMVRYKVELEGDSLETATNLTLTVEETDPIRLLYEVGLPDDVNAVNLEQKVQEYLDKDGSNHIHKNADGTYTFYANAWGADHGVAPDISELSDSEKQVLTASVAESHFIPNTANERFYVLEDSLVYTRNGDTYSVLKSLPVAGGEYYFARTIVNVTDTNGAAEAVTQYEVLSAATVANTSNFDIVDNNCIVKAGTVRQTLSNLELEKAENRTDTIGYSDSLWVYVPGSDADDYNVYSFLGNNGKLTVTPASGIAVTKDVTEFASNADENETFTINVLLDWAYNENSLAALAVTDTNGNALTEGTDYTVADAAGKILVKLMLRDDETACITGIPAGTSYTVEEAANSKYVASYTYSNENKAVAIGTTDTVTVTNVPVKPGNLYITKEVVHAHEGETFPTNYEFEFKVTFKDAEGNPLANKTFAVEHSNNSNMTQLTTDSDGVASENLKLKHGETAYIKGIDAGVVVTVDEINAPNNYTVAYRSRNATGLEADTDNTVTIISDSNATVVATNTYTPKSTTVDLDIPLTKTFVAESVPTEVITFIFEVQQWNGTAWESITRPNGNDVVCYMHFRDNDTVVGENVINHTIQNALEGITYTQAGVYSYQVIEQIPNDEEKVPGLVYDRTLWTFTVTVTDVDGQLVATVTDMNNHPITDGSYEVSFVNQSHAAPVSINIKKNVDDKSNNPLTSKAGFQFVAVQTNENWEALTGEDASSLSLYSDGAGEARMSATYKAEGHYYYVVTETNDGRPGWTYSETEYKIEVVVTKDAATGNLTANLIVNNDDQGSDNAEITFENTYDPANAKVELDTLVGKKLTGRSLTAGEFTFAIFENGKAEFNEDGTLKNIEDAFATGTNDQAGNVSFQSGKSDQNKDITFVAADNEGGNRFLFGKIGKYEFDVIEVKGSLGGMTYDSTIYDLVVEVTDAGDGTLKAADYFEDSTETTVVFNNTYTAEPTEVVIEGSKSIKVNSGVKTLTAGMFTFGLYDNLTGEKIAETTNLANDSFVFDAITYQEPGNYTYTVKEIAPDGTTNGSYSANGMSYSGEYFVVIVRVTDNGDGTLSAEVTGNGTDNIKFVNEYTSKLAPASLEGTKTLSGRDLDVGEFQFAIYKSDSTFTEHTLMTDQITNDVDGKVTFDFGTLDMGYHYFVVKEVIPEERAAGIHYDASEYHVTVQVTDSGNGQMSAATTVKHTGDPNAINPDITFKNVYRPEDTSVLIDGTKVLEGRPLIAEEFSFQLLKDGVQIDEAKVNADGTFAFDTITYTADDIGPHTYTVKEVIPADAVDTITYDNTEYEVEVTVTDNNGVLEVSKTVNDSASAQIIFTNKHTPVSIPLELEATKTYTKPLQGGDFTFTLTGEGFKKQEKTNDADGKIVFDTLMLSEDKTYTFTIKEEKNGFWFIKWDENVYTVTVTVANRNGELVIVEQTVQVEDAAKNSIVFNNAYVLDGEDTLALTVQKTMTGDRTDPSGFKFGLYDAAGTLVETITSDSDGIVSFKTLTFNETHVGQTYRYTVKEILPTDDKDQAITSLNGVTYDDTVYTVDVTVADNNEGGVKVTYKVDGQNVDQETYKFLFQNTYTAKPATITIDVQKLLDNKTEKTISLKDFQFQLTSGKDVHSAVSDAEGHASFKVTFNASHIGQTYKFKVSEKNTGIKGMTYDKTVHTITVQVQQNADGTLKTLINDQEADSVVVRFTNTYEELVTPPLGDSFQVILPIALMLLSILGVVVVLSTRKKKTA